MDRLTRIAILGSRDYIHLDRVDAMIDLLPVDGVRIVSGDGVGVDRQAIRRARARGMRTREFPPDYEKYGRYRAPKERNTEIANFADQAIVFWSGRDGGTTDVVGKFATRGKPVQMVYDKDKEETVFLRPHWSREIDEDEKDKEGDDGEDALPT